MGVYRPIGVIALAIISFIFAGLGIILSIVIQTVGISGYYQNLFMQYTLLSYLISRPQYIGLNFNSISFGYIQSEIIYLGIGSVMVLIFSGLCILASIGLLRMKNWGLYLGLTVGIFSIIIGTFLFLGLLTRLSPTFGIHGFLFGIPFFVFGIVTLVLVGTIKYKFQ